jgi:hypothetical protein
MSLALFAKLKDQILANTPELLYYAYISYFLYLSFTFILAYSNHMPFQVAEFCAASMLNCLLGHVR